MNFDENLLSTLNESARMSNVCIRIVQFIQYAESNNDYAVSTDTLRCIMKFAIDEDIHKVPAKYIREEFEIFLGKSTDFV